MKNYFIKLKHGDEESWLILIGAVAAVTGSYLLIEYFLHDIIYGTYAYKGEGIEGWGVYAFMLAFVSDILMILILESYQGYKWFKKRLKH